MKTVIHDIRKEKRTKQEISLRQGIISTCAAIVSPPFKRIKNKKMYKERHRLSKAFKDF